MKKLFIAEKPSVAEAFANAMKCRVQKRDGYMEGDSIVVTWCVGHLVTMSYPDAYDPALKRWSKETLPFLPDKFKYEVIKGVAKQYKIVSGLLNREDIDTIYVCTDSGREGEYIYRLVDQMAKVPDTKDKRRVWIDSQTEEEVLRGIKEAKPLNAYDNIAASAYLRAKEDYLMGINFSRVLSVVYGSTVNDCVKSNKWMAVSVGRVMTCVLGMVVNREREIRSFVKTPFYRIFGDFEPEESENSVFSAEWKVTEGSKYYGTPYLYKDNGFKDRDIAEKMCQEIQPEREAVIKKIEKKREKKNPPLLFNLAELQNICSKVFKISPDQTLAITQELYEKKLVTYPRTDARVLSTAIAKEIDRNIKGLLSYPLVSGYADEILKQKMYQGIEKTKYVNDKQITDHYAIIPTGQGLKILDSMPDLQKKVYEVIVRRFLAIFYPPAVYQKVSIVAATISPEECFYTKNKILVEKGFLPVSEFSFKKKKENKKELPALDVSKLPAPHEIKRKLDEYVIGQDYAKKVMSVAVYNHYKRVSADAKILGDVEIEKSNMLMIGPTGSGKTYLVKTLARILQVPLAITDATTLTEAGYIGDDIESVVSKLLLAADNDVEKAEHGIIFIDEIDKIAKKKETRSRDVSGESVQQGMLKLLEGSEIEVPVGATSKNAMVPQVTVNTKDILFICGGAFPDLEDIIKTRLNKSSSMGFNADLKDKYDDEKNIMSYVTVDDLREYGMIPEFLGRLPIIYSLDRLDEDMLVNILKEPKNAILKQYQKLLELDEVKLEFTDDALRSIARKAMEKDTGARALRSIIEDFMLDIMYEIPKDSNIGSVTITEDVVEKKGAPVITMRA